VPRISYFLTCWTLENLTRTMFYNSFNTIIQVLCTNSSIVLYKDFLVWD
jgi:hypothetical protein